MQTETVAVAANPWASARGAARHLREALIMGGAYFAYMYTRTLVFDSEETALANARRVVNLEESIGFFWEPNWQAHVIDSAQALVIFFNWAYIFTFWPIILVTAVTMYIVNRRIYFYYRNIVLLTFFIALFAFMLFPLAPPRMLSEYFVDTIREFGPSFYASREAANYYNAFAAMPSLHFTWTVVLGLMFFRSGRLRTWPFEFVQRNIRFYSHRARRPRKSERRQPSLRLNKQYEYGTSFGVSLYRASAVWSRLESGHCSIRRSRTTSLVPGSPLTGICLTTPFMLRPAILSL